MALNFENINRISPWVTSESLQILNFKKKNLLQPLLSQQPPELPH